MNERLDAAWAAYDAGHSKAALDILQSIEKDAWGRRDADALEAVRDSVAAIRDASQGKALARAKFIFSEANVHLASVRSSQTHSAARRPAPPRQTTLTQSRGGVVVDTSNGAAPVNAALNAAWAAHEAGNPMAALEILQRLEGDAWRRRDADVLEAVRDSVAAIRDASQGKALARAKFIFGEANVHLESIRSSPTLRPAIRPTDQRPQSLGHANAPISRGTNGLAIASLVLGILWLYWIGSVLALVFGFIAKNQIERSGGLQGGRGLAVAGIVLGWVGVGLLILLVLAGVSIGVGA